VSSVHQSRDGVIRGLASTGLVNRFPDAAPHEAIIEWLPRLDVDGLELGIGRVWDLARVEHDLGSAGLRFATAHLDKRIGAELLDDPQAALAQLRGNCGLAAALGATIVVLHLWELPIGDRRLDENLALLPACLDVAEAAGVTLAIETIPCSVGTPLDNVRRALERDERCRVTLDTEFLARHDQLGDSLADDALWERVVHVHVKDYGGSLRDRDGTRRYLIPGEGQIDFEQVFGALRGRAYEGALTLEVSAVTAEGQVDEDRFRQVEAWLTSRPWLLQFELPARSRQNAPPYETEACEAPFREP
jgi:sugar phosphate isomerase/epimerase